MDSEIHKILAELHRAKSVDEGDACADKLAQAARKNVDEVIHLYYSTETEASALVSCLHGLTDKPVIDVYKHSLKNKDQYVRWAAVEGLKYSTDPALIPVFVAALKDRSHLVKLVAVEWLKSHGDSSAIGPLEVILASSSLMKNSPGIINQAKKAVKRLRAKAT